MGAESYSMTMQLPMCGNCGRRRGYMGGRFTVYKFFCSSACAKRYEQRVANGDIPTDETDDRLALRIRIKQLEHRVRDRSDLEHRLKLVGKSLACAVAIIQNESGGGTDEEKSAVLQRWAKELIDEAGWTEADFYRNL